MAERFVSRARQDDPPCTRCQHARAEHKHAGLCTGLGDEKAMSGLFCGCASYQGPRRFRNEGSRTWTPTPQERTGFTETSSRTQIGDGRAVPRPNLQGKRTVGGADPDWAMFGVARPDGRVRVYASTSLSYLELRQEAGHFDDLHQDMIGSGSLSATPWDFSGRMVDYVVVTAVTYAEAVRMLFASGWSPDGDAPGPSTADLQRQAALDEAQRAAEDAERAAHPLVRARVSEASNPNWPFAPVVEFDEIVEAEVVDDDE